MASLMFSKACERVSPCEMQPGKEGTSATKTPSSSCSINTRYFILYSSFPNGANDTRLTATNIGATLNAGKRIPQVLHDPLEELRLLRPGHFAQQFFSRLNRVHAWPPSLITRPFGARGVVTAPPVVLARSLGCPLFACGRSPSSDRNVLQTRMRYLPQRSPHGLGKLDKDKVIRGIQIILAFVVDDLNIAGLRRTLIG